MVAARRSELSVVAVNGGLATVVLTLVAVLALVVKPPAPPGIAAFAPQAAKPITKAPPEQSSANGSGAGSCAAGQVCAGPSATAPASPAPSVSTPPKSLFGAAPAGLQCYTWPNGTVTQTFDPQSPPCISTWDDSKGNGGATWTGVSASEIRVALPQTGGTTMWPSVKPLVDFFNTHYQLYGRKIVVVPVKSAQAEAQASGDGYNDPALQRADATQIARSKVFASFDFVDPVHYSWSLPAFRDVLTKHQIVSIAGGEMTPYTTEALRAPYEWTYYPPIGSLMDNYARAVCRQLAGRRAIHSTDAGVRATTRKFAVVVPTDEQLGGPLPGLTRALRTLDACGVKDPRVVRYNGSRQELTTLAAGFREMQQDGVTSMLFFPYAGTAAPQSPPTVASNVGFRPEWVLIGWNQYLTSGVLFSPSDETRAAFGVAIWNKSLHPLLEFWRQAFVAAGGSQEGGAFGVKAFYNELMVLAAGLQMAGPRLTPESFSEGLRSTEFPNPGGGNAPFYQGTVGFTDDTTMVDDFNQFWLDTRTTGAEVIQDRHSNEVRWNCFVGMGRRWTFDSWGTADEYYKNTACR